MSKRLVEDCYVIKVSDLAGLGWKGMVDGNAGPKDHSLTAHWLRVGPLADRKMTSVTLLGAPGDGQPAEEFLIEATGPNYGGSRYWFVCSNCFRRIQKLFRPPDAESFACRQCFDLAYASQREHKFHRALRRARKVRRELGGGPNVVDPFPTKPKRMRWKTWKALEFADSITILGALHHRIKRIGRSKVRRRRTGSKGGT